MAILKCRRNRYLFLALMVFPKPNPQQQMYHVPPRPQDPVGQDAGHNYPRHDGGEVDADAEGERDYEVG
jgi:nuclear transcription factor Y gamma